MFFLPCTFIEVIGYYPAAAKGMPDAVGSYSFIPPSLSRICLHMGFIINYLYLRNSTNFTLLVDQTVEMFEKKKSIYLFMIAI